jgi:predicted TIM-barrel fold metal-dependent hydrolase
MRICPGSVSAVRPSVDKKEATSKPKKSSPRDCKGDAARRSGLFRYIRRFMPKETASAAPPLCAPPDFRPRRPQLRLPALACDCHAHILGPASRHRYAERRVYTPPDCLLPDYERMLTALGLERAVLVQPSVYAQDNTVLLEALERGGTRFRGVAVVGEDAAEPLLDRLHSAGVRGVRANIVDVPGREPGALPMSKLRALAARIAPLGWHLELLLHADEFPELDRALAGFPVDVVLGHLGYMQASRGLDDAGFRALLRLLARGRCWVKLTGPYRISGRALPYADVVPFARALAEARADRLLWGSDWPHVMLRGAMPNDADLLDLVSAWLPDESERRGVLVDNPARLYGF